ncbi:MAG TPA: hypothetical protein VGY48_35675 [Vicinamibacterales bacterium]|jgi:hypothetical protein|nr:hypothetical protein [Vicinamibacterales bacterium]
MLKTARTIASLGGAGLVAALTAGTVVSTVGTDVVTYHNDVGRTGQNLTETALTLATVNPSMFGKLGVWATDGKVDAQPLYLSAVSIPGQGAKNMLYVETEHDSVYGFNADNGTGVWGVSLLGTGEVPSDTLGCGQVVPEIGITSTPVIDRSAGPNGVIYVVAMSKIAGTSTYFQRLHALDVTSGAELFGGPRVIQATFSRNSTTVTFDPKKYEERAALLLANGRLVLAFTSHCDAGPYSGWMMAYDPATLNQTAVLNVTPNGGGGAFWMAGDGPAADAAGNFYILSGNGTFDTTLDGNGFPTNGDFGNGFLKISMTGGLSVADYFQSWDTVAKSNGDTDLGSGGAIVLPDLLDGGGQVRHLAVGAGKDSHIYVVDRDSMSKWNPSTNQNYQDISGGLSGGVFATPAYFNGTVYYGAVGDAIKAFPITAARLATTAATRSAHTFGYPGATPGISASGTTNGIVWAVENSNPAVLHAFDATNLAHELYNSTQAAGGRDNFGAGNKFITPTIVNGHVYVGTGSGVAAFGNITTIPISPTNVHLVRGDGLQ